MTTNLEWLWEHDREKLIAMASESCDCATCVYGWRIGESWQCGDERWTAHCTEGNREWLMAPHANDDFTPESVVTGEIVDANDGNDALDSREKLEADDMDSAVYVQKCPNDEPPENDAIEHARWRWKYRPEYGDEVVMGEHNCNLLMSDLDAIADMVERDYVSREKHDEAMLLKMIDIGVHRTRCNELEAERNELKRKLEAAQDVNERQDLEYVSLSREIGTLRAERDHYRELCGKLLDAADEMRRVRDAFDQFVEVDR